MTKPSPAKLLKAKDLLQHSFCRGNLVLANPRGEGNSYCALGAIGKAHGLSDNDLIKTYLTIPLEDVVVLANVIDPAATKHTIERIKKDRFYTDDFYQIVYRYNDRKGKEATLEKFSQACKEYKKHLPVVEDFKKALKDRDKKKIALAYDD